MIRRTSYGRFSRFFRRRLSAGIILLFFLSLFPAIYAAGISPYVADSILVIPGGTVTIPDFAFRGRSDFHSLRFEAPVRLTSIGEYAFWECGALREVLLPRSVSKLGQGAFRECGSLRRANLPGVTAIPREAFRECPALEDVTLSPSTGDIAAHAFAYCAALRAISFPATVTHIGSNAFSFCSSIEEILLPRRLKELESYAFSECISLRRATLPANSKMLGEYIFSGCRALEEIIEPSPVPPTFDCGSPLFEDGERELFDRCRLLVPPSSLSRYRASAPWALFSRILPL